VGCYYTKYCSGVGCHNTYQVECATNMEAPCRPPIGTELEVNGGADPSFIPRTFVTDWRMYDDRPGRTSACGPNQRISGTPAIIRSCALGQRRPG
jgi:hypothetical protein